jgi:hypothetical protein
MARRMAGSSSTNRIRLTRPSSWRSHPARVTGSVRQRAAGARSSVRPLRAKLEPGGRAGEVIDIRAAAGLPPRPRIVSAGRVLAIRNRLLTARRGRLTTRRGRLTARRGRLTARRGRLTARRRHLTARRRRLTTRRGRLTTRRGGLGRAGDRFARRRGRVGIRRIGRWDRLGRGLGPGLRGLRRYLLRRGGRVAAFFGAATAEERQGDQCESQGNCLLHKAAANPSGDDQQFERSLILVSSDVSPRAPTRPCR